MNLKRDEFACEKIDPYEVRWARVMIIYKLLSMGADFGEDGSPESVSLKERYMQWIGYSLQKDSVEFNLAMLILFDIQTDFELSELWSKLGLQDDEEPEMAV